MAIFQRCSACDYQPLARQTSVRPPPWLPDAGQHSFYFCKNCGGLTIQTQNNATGHQQLWLLEPAAMSLLRLDANPVQVIRYLASDDFFNNRGVTDGLFRGWVRSAMDVSMCVNDLSARLAQTTDPKRLAAIVEQLSIVLAELATRMYTSADVECRISSLSGLLQACQGTFPHGQITPEMAATVRLHAFDALEILNTPWTWKLVPNGERQAFLDTLDHVQLVQRSHDAVQHARRRWHSDGALKLREEAAFLRGVFQRRDAFLPPYFGVLMWECLRDIHARMGLAQASTLQKCYDAVQVLLEEQLIAMRLEPISWRADGRTFQIPRSGEVLVLRNRVPQVEIYNGLRDQEPYRILDTWAEVMAFARTN